MGPSAPNELEGKLREMLSGVDIDSMTKNLDLSGGPGTRSQRDWILLYELSRLTADVAANTTAVGRLSIDLATMREALKGKTFMWATIGGFTATVATILVTVVLFVLTRNYGGSA